MGGRWREVLRLTLNAGNFLLKSVNLSLPKQLVELAKAEIGVEEIDGTNCSPRVNEYKAATNLPPTDDWPWCAAFVCWIVREAFKLLGVKETATFKRPTTAAAWGLEAWSLRQDNSTHTRRKPQYDILPGDIICFTFSHCGIAVTSPDTDGFFSVIEGNTDGQGSREGGAVLRKTRNISKVRSRIRFMVNQG